jgi:hypothetical protein
LLFCLGLFAIGIGASLEHLAEVVFADGLPLLLLFFDQVDLVLDTLILNFLALLVLSASAKEGTALLQLLLLKLLILGHGSSETFILSSQLF